MSDHADTIRRAVEIPAGEDGWRAFLNAHDDEELREFSVVRREDALALLAERDELRLGVMHYQERANKAEADRQQAVDALREASSAFDHEVDGNHAKADWLIASARAALVKLGEKP